MIIVSLALCGVLLISSVAWILVVKVLLDRAAEERKLLEEKLVAVCHPVAYTSVKANEDLSLSVPTYVDDEREVELEDGTPKAA